jgi:prepilin-type N-terminal cleavage/methylation domain-containing protein
MEFITIWTPSTSIKHSLGINAGRITAKHGWTLVELLVVIAVIGILVGLLLPAVQAAREAARKVYCLNNLRQVGIAIHNYHDSNRTMPPGCLQWRPFRGDPRLKSFAWSALILPYMEQSSLHSMVDFDYPFDHVANDLASRNSVSTYVCPTVPFKETLRGRSDYGGLYGQRITVRDNTDNGVFIYNRPIRFGEISDGLTNTLAVAEAVGGPDAEWINGNNIFEQSGRINDPTAWIGDDEIRSLHTGGAMMLFCCGRTQFMSDGTDTKLLAALITRRLGEIGGP